jgi:RNA polymerase sigma-70 factor (ECF subfamily)
MRQAQNIVEEILVTRVKMGDATALERLAGLRGPRLLAHAARLTGDREAARDIVQDAWIEILRGLPGLREPRAFPAWATRIVTRCCARHIRGQIAGRNLAADLAVEAACTPPEDTVDAIDRKNLKNAIDALPREQAVAIALFYLEDMRVTEISVALDIPQGTVKTRLMHAREKLKQALKGYDDEQAG